MTETKAKEIIESLMPMQERGDHIPCPRCGHDRMHFDRPALNALSRRAKVYICETCGMEEALLDMQGKPPLPLTAWSLPISLTLDGEPEGGAKND